MNKNYAYANVITNTRYNKCIKRNAQRMRYLNCKYPLIVMVADIIEDNEIQDLYEESNIIIKKFKYINYFQYYKNNNFFNEGIALNDYVFEADTVHKFQILSLIDYDKILFLDADSIFIDSPDYCFIKYKIKNNQYVISNGGEHFGVCGEKIMIKPNMELYNFLFNDRLKKAIHFNDEHINKLYFYNNLQDLDSINTLHFSCIVKLWEMPENFFDYFFRSCCSDMFNNLMDNYCYELSEIRFTAHEFSKSIKKMRNKINLYKIIN